MTTPTTRARTGARGPDAARDTGTVAALTLVSRLTGFVRIVAVAAVLGTTFLGNTYQTANTVPNIVFELVAAGVLTAVLLPSLVRLLDGPDPSEAEHVARSVLGLVGAALGVLALLGIVLAPQLMRALLSAVPEGEGRADQVRVGTLLLRCFLPQLVLYAAGMVATGVLHARGRFALPAIAPVLNNVVVTATYVAFWLMTRDGGGGLDLTTAEQLVLGLGTTAGVVAFCAVPVVAVVRSGTSLWPRFDHRHPEVRRLGRLGGWAAVQLGSTQLLLAVVLVLANAVEGGVVAYQLAFTVFLLPHAVVALPVATALYPALARSAAAHDGTGFATTTTDGLLAVLLLTAPAAAGLVALGQPLAELLSLGEAEGGARQIAGAIAGFGPGLLGYGALVFLTRASYAAGNTRTPALVHLGVLLGGGAAMVAAAAVVDGADLVAWLAAAHSGAHLLGALALLRPARAAAGRPDAARLARPLAFTVASAVLAGAVMGAVVQVVDGGGRASAALALAVAGTLGLATYLAGQRLGGVRPATVPALLRGRPA